MEPIEGSATSAIINQTPGNYPKENLLYRENYLEFSAGLGVADDSVVKYSARKRSVLATRGRERILVSVQYQPCSAGADLSAQWET